jgi:hypothetical protein
MLIADWSMTTSTRMALTCQDMKKRLVSAVRARKGLRLLARRPMIALRAQEAGLFEPSVSFTSRPGPGASGRIHQTVVRQVSEAGECVQAQEIRRPRRIAHL